MPPAKTQTFGEHISELRQRFFYVLLVVVVASSLGWAFSNQLFRFVQRPLGQQLYYTSPIGGFNAIVKISVLVGLIAGVPFLIYQLCQFIAPAFKNQVPKRPLKLFVASIVLAVGGAAFGYYVSLPASLRFLTHIGAGNFQPLIVVNDYLNFVFSYLLGFALLFQLPLFIGFINSRMGPFKPRKLMGLQRWVILVSFIVAAILTPTPDPLNQAIMAAPIILLYQFSVLIVMFQNRRLNRARAVTNSESASWEKPAEPVPADASSAAIAQPRPRPVFMDIIPPHAVNRRPVA